MKRHLIVGVGAAFMLVWTTVVGIRAERAIDDILAKPGVRAENSVRFCSSPSAGAFLPCHQPPTFNDWMVWGEDV